MLINLFRKNTQKMTVKYYAILKKILFQWNVGHHQSTHASFRMHFIATHQYYDRHEILTILMDMSHRFLKSALFRGNLRFHLSSHLFISAKVIEPQFNSYKIRTRWSETTFLLMYCKLKYLLQCFTCSCVWSMPE